MNNFTFYSPTKVIFGKGVENQIGEQAAAFGAKKMLILYGGGSVKRSGLLERVEKSLEAAGIEYIDLGGVQPNPRLSLVHKAIELGRAEKIDMILAVGGGSTIDTAKAVAMGIPYDGDIWDVYAEKVQPKEALPTCNIVTLAAAGSETSPNTVITNEDGMLKKGFQIPMLRPKFTLMNPELLYTLPPYQTACGVVDILMHTFERYFVAGEDNVMTDRIAEALLKTVMEYGIVCMKDPKNYRARSEVMWAGSLSHNHLTGLGREEDWATHRMEHELGGLYDVAHGAGLSAIWGSWARYVCKQSVTRFARYGVNVLGLSYNYDDPMQTALEAIEATERYFKQIDMPISIPELIGRPATEAEIIEMAEKGSNYGKKTLGNVIKLKTEDIANIYRMANN